MFFCLGDHCWTVGHQKASRYHMGLRLPENEEAVKSFADFRVRLWAGGGGDRGGGCNFRCGKQQASSKCPKIKTAMAPPAFWPPRLILPKGLGCRV